MVNPSAVDAVRVFWARLRERGIQPASLVLFGSHARGEQHAWSDIDVVVVAPEFEPGYPEEAWLRLCAAKLESDLRIEAVPCGVSEWEDSETRPLIDIARREGVAVSPGGAGG